MTMTDTVGERRRAREALIELVTRLVVRSRKAGVDCDCRGSNGGGTILAMASSARHVCSTHRLLIVGRFDDNALVLGHRPSTDRYGESYCSWTWVIEEQRNITLSSPLCSPCLNY